VQLISMALEFGNRDMLIAALKVESNDAWRDACERTFNSTNDLAADAQGLFVEFGHRIRDRINDDLIMTKLLQRMLPPFTGSGMQLFRGENADRYHEGQIGFCWTPKREIAEMFGSGLNAMAGAGGLLLSSLVRSSAIIAGPNAHSMWLGEEEYWVCPSRLEEVTILAKYPNMDH
jgi:hypothetical protein